VRGCESGVGVLMWLDLNSRGEEADLVGGSREREFQVVAKETERCWEGLVGWRARDVMMVGEV
jgi:hypothetical protein